MRIARAMVVLSAGLLGCQHFDRAGDCRALADAINPDLSVLAANYSRFNPNSDDEYRAASQRYEHAATRLDAVHFKNPEMTSLVMQMRENLRSSARSCDRLASSLRQHEQGGDSQAIKELEIQHQRHSSLVAIIDRACQLQ